MNILNIKNRIFRFAGVFLLFALSSYELHSQNLLLNASFENGSTDWVLESGATIVSNNAQSGSNSLSASNAAGGAHQWVYGLIPNTTYRLTAWARSTDASEINIMVKNYGGNRQDAYVNSTSYTQVTLTFTTGSASGQAKIHFTKTSSTSGTAYIDNLSLEYVSGSPYQLVWSDEFNGTGPVDTADWKFENGFVRNEELQWYQEDNAYQENGMLVIEGRKETFPNPNYVAGSDDWKTSRANVEYTSSSIKTATKHTWLYGRFEVRAKVTNFTGTWPAIWTLGESCEWPSNGEVDIMENYGNKLLANFAWGTDTRWSAKWDGASISFDNLPAGWASDFHIWTLDWTEDRMTIYVDDIWLNTVELSGTINGAAKCPGENPFQQPHYILLNLALGSNGGSVSNLSFPTKYLVDYVRIYQVPSTVMSPPVAYAGGPYSSTVSNAVAFSSAGSYDSDGSLVSYSWDFGDGSTTSSEANPAHTYTVPGTYTVKLTVTDNDGASNTTQTTVTISSGSTYYYIVCKKNNVKLRPETESTGSQMIFTEGANEGDWVQWEQVVSENGYFYLKNKHTGLYFRPITDSDLSRMEQQATTSNGNRTQWTMTPTVDGDGYFHFYNRASSKKMRIIGTSFSNPYIEQAPDGSTGDWTRWNLVPVSTSSTRFAEGEESNSDDLPLMVYPNPSNDFVTIEGAFTSYQLFDLNGKLRSIGNDSKIEIGHLSNGLYLLRIKMVNGRILERKVFKE